MRRTIFIDIESLPAQHLTVSGFPAVTPAPTDENHLETALNGDFGRLLCIGFIDEFPRGEIERGVIGWDNRQGEFYGDERIILTEFWQRMKSFRPNIDRIVGHNIYDFDLKFILKRSIVHGVRPTVDLSFARYRNQPIYDTMYELRDVEVTRAIYKRMIFDESALALFYNEQQTQASDLALIH